MKRKKFWISIASVVAIVAIAATITLLLKDKNADMASSEIQEMSITVQKAIEQELTETILVTGEIVPESEQKVFMSQIKERLVNIK